LHCTPTHLQVALSVGRERRKDLLFAVAARLRGAGILSALAFFGLPHPLGLGCFGFQILYPRLRKRRIECILVASCKCLQHRDAGRILGPIPRFGDLTQLFGSTGFDLLRRRGGPGACRYQRNLDPA